MKGTVFILEDDTSICGLIKVALEMNGLDFQGVFNLEIFYRRTFGRTAGRCIA